MLESNAVLDRKDGVLIVLVLIVKGIHRRTGTGIVYRDAGFVSHDKAWILK
jgi:hypothetical protein